ncbi:MAG: mannose-6-phosphate isomerase, class I [Microbacterium sp.]
MLIAISNTPRDYSWGAIDLIPALQGRVPTGAPEAEIWYGDHPGSPSVTRDGRTLDVVLGEAGQPPLPFLLKLLAAGSSLSIQAHPTKAQALAGFAREEQVGLPRDGVDRLYRDANHKPEIIVALSERFDALVGLRPLAATRRFVAGLGAGAASIAARLVDDERSEQTVLREAVAWALTDAEPATVTQLASALDAAASDGDTAGGALAEFADEIAVLRCAAADFPGDAGLIVALLMNHVRLSRGEALFAPAGVLHAYQYGLGVELMAASDNVLRGGLTPKHVDVPELLRVLDARPGPAPLVTPRAVADGVWEFAPGVPDFALTRATVSAPVELALRGPAIVLATAGSVRVAAGAASVELGAGQGAYLGDERTVTLTGAGEAFVAQPGGDTP